MKRKISTQQAAGFAFIVLITVAVISITANGLISHQFEQYVAAAAENVIGAGWPSPYPFSIMRKMEPGM